MEEATDGTWSVEEATREVTIIEGKRGDIGHFTRHLKPLVHGSRISNSLVLALAARASVNYSNCQWKFVLACCQKMSSEGGAQKVVALRSLQSKVVCLKTKVSKLKKDGHKTEKEVKALLDAPFDFPVPKAAVAAPRRQSGVNDRAADGNCRLASPAGMQGKRNLSVPQLEARLGDMEKQLDARNKSETRLQRALEDSESRCTKYFFYSCNAVASRNKAVATADKQVAQAERAKEVAEELRDKAIEHFEARANALAADHERSRQLHIKKEARMQAELKQQQEQHAKQQWSGACCGMSLLVFLQRSGGKRSRRRARQRGGQRPMHQMRRGRASVPRRAMANRRRRRRTPGGSAVCLDSLF